MNAACDNVAAVKQPDEAEERDQSASDFQQRIGQYMVGAMTSNLIYLGDRLGLYAALKDHGPCSSDTLSSALDLNERYVREWLYQQASARVISCDADAVRFWLNSEQQDVLVHEHGEHASPLFSAGGFESIPGFAKVASEKLPHCFKTGEGSSYDGFDEQITCGTCRELGVWARHHLVKYLSTLPDVKAKLDQGCEVADVGCGCGEALLTAAQAWPPSTFKGYDISEKALKVARSHAAAAGVSNVSFHNPGIEEEELPTTPTFDLVMTHDAIHDMARPDRVIPHVLKAMKSDACWIIGDISSLASQAATVHSHPLAPMLYGFSCHLCLPSGLSTPDALGLGTTGLPKPAMVALLQGAGFEAVEELP